MTRWISPVLFAAIFGPAAFAQMQPAVIVVRVPADAEVVIGSQRMTQTGPERRFVTNPLENGIYVYDVTVSWTEGAKKFKKTRQVEFTPGKTAVIEFNSPPALARTNKPDVVPTSFDGKPKEEVKSRTFHFIYSGKVTDLPPGKAAKIWLPKPATTPEQDVVFDQTTARPAFRFGRDKVYGNAVAFTEAVADDAGEVYFSLGYRVTRREVKTDARLEMARKRLESDDLIIRYLLSDAKVPISGKPLELVKDKKLPNEPVARARALYDVVDGHVRYSKEGAGWGQGDAVWVCSSKFGNCTDFHSLFISLARGHLLAAKFEMGFSIPSKRGAGAITGYHCWAWFLPPGEGWIPVDISEANRHPEMKDYYFGNLTEDRVQFTTGRDIVLEPRQAGPPLNFFIYPYVEVDGQPYPAEQVQRAFAYKDVD